MFDRRDFLKFIGGGAVGTLATPVIWQGLDDVSIWTQNWPWIPRIDKGNNKNVYVRTTSKLCPSAAGLRVRLVNGRPVRALGDVDHPLSRGGLSALAAAEVQLLYSPARLRRPLKRSDDGTYVAISWDEAQSILTEKLAAAKAQKSLFCLSGDENGTMNEVLSALTARAGSNDFYMMPSDAQSTAAAWRAMGGTGRVGYDFANSDYVLAVGAGVLENWGPVVANRRAWGQARPADGKLAMRVAYAGPMQNNTAAGADLWLPVRPGADTAFLLGLVHELAASGSVPEGFAPLKDLAAKWDAEHAAAVAGIAPASIVRVAKELREAKAPLVIVGSETGQGCPAAPVILGIALNIMLGRLNRDGGMRALPVAAPALEQAMSYDRMMQQDFMAAAAAMAAGKRAAPALFLAYEANPVYAMPAPGVDKLIEDAGFSVSFSCFLDETARRCDLVLPAAMGLERFDDVVTPYGVGEAVYALSVPVARPLFEARAAGDVLLTCAANAEMKLGFSSYLNVLRAKVRRIGGVEWETLLKGECAVTRRVEPVLELALPMQILKEAAQAVPDKPAKGALAVATVTKRAFGTPDSGLPPFATKLVGKDIAGSALTARMNRATAEKAGLREGQMIRLSAGKASIPAKVVLFEGVAQDSVALAAGFGHTDFDSFNDGKGANVMRLFSVVEEPGTGLAVWSCPDVTVAKA